MCHLVINSDFRNHPPPPTLNNYRLSLSREGLGDARTSPSSLWAAVCVGGEGGGEVVPNGRVVYGVGDYQGAPSLSIRSESLSQETSCQKLKIFLSQKP